MSTTDGGITVVPANEASWEDLDVVLGPARCHSARCYCQRYKIPNSQWNQIDDDECAFLLRAETNCGNPESDTTSGLVAYFAHQPVGWCAIEPRTAYKKLVSSRVPWAGRNGTKTRTTMAFGPSPASLFAVAIATAGVPTSSRAQPSNSLGSGAPVPLRGTP
jgi:hypothetical protein